MADRVFRLAALDMDGTLLNTAHQVTPYTREVLRECAEAGKVITLSTGRCLSELRAFFDQIPAIAYAICESGACVYDPLHKRALLQITMDDDDVDAIFDASRDLDTHFQVFVDNQSCMSRGDAATLDHFNILDFKDAFDASAIYYDDIESLCKSNRGHVEKINLYFPGTREQSIFAGRMAGRDLAVTGSVGIGCECSPARVSKSSGLRFLCDTLGIPIEQTLAVGDGGNDLDIMAAAGFSVAMGNAIEPVRALSHAVTDDCDHDGCARALEKYLLGR